jgi:precorrin-2 dehydrogenase/sirohydrochlorin ferrochelatase
VTAPLYGVWLDLRGRTCLVVGGGAVAARRVRGLLECGARVRVVAPSIHPDLEALATEGALTVERRAYQAGDTAGAALVCAATSSREVNAAVAAEARASGVLVNVADRPAEGDLQVGAVVRRGPIAVSLGTGGLSPAATAALRAWLAALLTADHERAVLLLGEARGRPALAATAHQAAALLSTGDARGAASLLEDAQSDLRDGG